jgi:hypothetical protein
MLPVLSPKPSYKLPRERRKPWARRHAGSCHSLMHVVEIALDRGVVPRYLALVHAAILLSRRLSILRYTSRHG